MAKIRNISGDNRVLPWLGDRRVDADEVVDVPIADVYAYTQQVEVWEPVDDVAQAAHDEGAADAERSARAAEPEEPLQDPPSVATGALSNDNNGEND